MKFVKRVLGVGALLVVLLAICAPTATLAANDPNAFSILSFEGDYYLEKDGEDRSRMRVTEKLVVQFPPFDQNHGLERAIPERYDGHNVRLEIKSVKNNEGKAWPYSSYGSNKNTVLRIGDPDTYVRSVQVYVIEYVIHDVTKDFDGHDELFWDTNGTDWGQTFGRVAARLHMKGEVADAYQGKHRCFEGSQGSTSSCTVTENKKDGETVLTFSASRMLYAGENLSMVTSFDKGTFESYKPTTWERLWPWLLGLWLASGAIVLVVVGIKMWRAYQLFGKSPAGRGTIVPEYLPPKGMSVLTASVIVKKDGKDETAEIIDLAVRHYIKIYETETKGSWFRNKKSYELELIKKPVGLHPEERRLVEIIFGAKAEVGSRVTIEALKHKLYRDAANLQKNTTEANALQKGWLADMSAQRKRYYWIGGILLAAGIVLINIGTAIAGLVVILVASAFHPLTEKGVERRDYLRGLEMYMKLAEAERMRVLQSPSGATKTSVDPKDKKQLVHLYERLLPYAIIFGLEEEWAKAFAPLYDKQPDWYEGNWSAFNAGVFASSLGSFTSTSNTTFTPPSNSSSSGFSGGGFSGGGGGGGGGGGW